MAYDKSKIPHFKEKIIEMLSEGFSLKKILDDNKEFPRRPIVYQWLNAEHKNYDKEFFNNYVRAREEFADTVFEDILNIADDNREDIRMTENGAVVNHDNIQRSRLRVDARKWVLARMKPKKYGDKIDVTSDGEKVESSQINVSYNGKDVNLSS
tara:strand:+ start:494 stop:955 length:462 start_codon:yes stop_codon:yes gene_type:complete